MEGAAGALGFPVPACVPVNFEVQRLAKALGVPLTALLE